MFAMKGKTRLALSSVAMGIVVAGAFSGCQRSSSDHGASTSGANAQADAGYLAPPVLTVAARDAGGGVVLSGQAPAETEVRLRSPGGAAFSALAGDDGGWSVRLPPATEPEMFAFEGQLAGRTLHGEGAIVVLPSPGPAAVLARSGYGALAIVPSTAGPLRILTIDYDGAGGGAVSGVTGSREPVRLMLDNVAIGAGQADDQGRFTVLDLNTRAPFSLGAHTVAIESGNSTAKAPLTVHGPTNLGDDLFKAEREDAAWRVDWRIPGGGQQTSLMFDLTSAPRSLKSPP